MNNSLQTTNLPSNFCVFTISCARDRSYHKAARHTWLDVWGEFITHRFVLGAGNDDPQPDELVFDVSDSYDRSIDKHQKAFEWAIDHGFAYAFVHDIDNYIAVSRLHAASRSLKDPYVGRTVSGGSYASGAAGYWVRADAMRVLISAKLMPPYADKAIGEALSAAKIRLTHDPRYWTAEYGEMQVEDYGRGFWINDELTTAHLGRATGVYDPQWLYDCHRFYLTRPKVTHP